MNKKIILCLLLVVLQSCNFLDTVKDKTVDLYDNIVSPKNEIYDQLSVGQIREYENAIEFSWVQWKDKILSDIQSEKEKDAIDDLLSSVFQKIESESHKIIKEYKKDIRYLIAKTKKGKDIIKNKHFLEFSSCFIEKSISEKSLEILLNEKIMLENKTQDLRLHTVRINRPDQREIISPMIFVFIGHNIDVQKDGGDSRNAIKTATEKALVNYITSRYAELFEKLNIVEQITCYINEK